MDLSVSQNFTVNNFLVKKLIKEANFSSDDLVLDIGAGKGALSVELAQVCRKVYVFEYDSKFELALRGAVQELNNVEVIIGNFLDFDLNSLDKYKVFSNIPFSISSDIFNKLFFADNPPVEAFLFVQKEAALRFMGIGEGTMFSLLLKPFFDMKIVYEFLPTDFEPVPSVDTVLLRVKKLDVPMVKVEQQDIYKNFVVYTLYQQKPTLKLRLDKVFTYEQFKRLSRDLGFALDVVASDLSLDQWIGLFKYYLIGVDDNKKFLVAEFGKSWFKNNSGLSGPSRTKLRK